MKVLVIGASGLVGNNCFKHFAESGDEVVGTYFSYEQQGLHYFNTLDLHDDKNFDVVGFNPDVIIHCGAMTHVDRCETEQDESYRQTVMSTEGAIALAQKTKATLVYYSTDYVFDGLNGPYAEDAPTRPLSVYGQHKLDAEQKVAKANINYLILRVTNIYGNEARGKNFVARIVDQCKNGQHLTLKLPKDQYASPTNAWDIARATRLLLNGGHQGIFHIGGFEYMNRVELALSVVKHFPNATYSLEAVDTASLNQPAARPLRGGFFKAKFSNLFPDFLFGTVSEFVETCKN